ncbi:MAG: outer membrane beta-barrel protein, partial [Betaproteobacteria bacterium]
MKLIKWNWLGIDTFLLLAGFAAMSAAYAGQDSGGYFGAGIGKASVSDYCSDTGGLVVTSCDDSDMSFKIFGGYRFTRNIAVEAAYVDLGKYPATVSAGVPVNVSVKLTGVTVQAVGIVPFGNEFSVMGRIGAILWDLNSSASVPGFSTGSSDTGVDIAMGVGAQYKFTPSFGVR